MSPRRSPGQRPRRERPLLAERVPDHVPPQPEVHRRRVRQPPVVLREVLQRRAPLTLNAIADHCGIDKTQMSREVKDLVERIVHDVDLFAEGEEQSDDITCLALRRHPRASLKPQNRGFLTARGLE